LLFSLTDQVEPLQTNDEREKEEFKNEIHQPVFAFVLIVTVKKGDLWKWPCSADESKLKTKERGGE
jgi:hypothetical protein